jgi:hypothetical protein
VVACGALGGHLREIAGRRGWDVEIVCLPSMLHNAPRQIAPAAERIAADLQAAGKRVVLAYADCGTYGELDRLCERLGLARLPGLHCYDVFAGPERIRAALEAEPGTYLLTDFLVRSFRHSVLEPLGLDRYPELWPDYFAHYRRVVWLAQSPDPGLARQAEEVAEMFGLPLTVVDVGAGRLEREFESLLAAWPARPRPAHSSPTRHTGPSLEGDKDYVKTCGPIEPLSLHPSEVGASGETTAASEVAAAPGAAA